MQKNSLKLKVIKKNFKKVFFWFLNNVYANTKGLIQLDCYYEFYQFECLIYIRQLWKVHRIQSEKKIKVFNLVKFWTEYFQVNPFPL